VYSDTRGVTTKTQRPAINASMMATLRAGSREAKNSMRLNIRTIPPISFSVKSSKVEISASGGLRNKRITSGLPPTIRSRSDGSEQGKNAQYDSQSAMEWSWYGLPFPFVQGLGLFVPEFRVFGEVTYQRLSSFPDSS